MKLGRRRGALNNQLYLAESPKRKRLARIHSRRHRAADGGPRRQRHQSDSASKKAIFNVKSDPGQQREEREVFTTWSSCTLGEGGTFSKRKPSSSRQGDSFLLFSGETFHGQAIAAGGELWQRRGTRARVRPQARCERGNAPGQAIVKDEDSEKGKEE